MRKTLMVLLSLALGSTASLAIPFDHLETSDDIGVNKVPHFGTSNILVIPMRVGTPLGDDEYADMSSVFDPEGGAGTFRGYYQAQSVGQYDPVPTLAEPLFYPECPIDVQNDDCLLRLTDVAVFTSGQIRELIQDMLERVQDEQGLDLREFDVNSEECATDGACPDGFFDGVIISTNIFGGLAFPVAAFSGDNAPVEVVVDGGGTVGVGIVALVRPFLHEFGHNLGLIDHYRILETGESGGPTTNDLMALEGRGFSAYSRGQLGWSTVQKITSTGTFTLPPVLDGGEVLYFGDEDRFVSIANRGGDKHSDFDTTGFGVYMHSVDRRQVPTSPLGFIDLIAGELYYPNQDSPYLNVVMPLGCSLAPTGGINPCQIVNQESRDIIHAGEGHLGHYLTVDDVATDGTATLTIHPGTVEDAFGNTDAGLPVSVDAGPGVDGGQSQPVVDECSDGCCCAAQETNPSSAFGIGFLGFIFLRRLSARNRTRP